MERDQNTGISILVVGGGIAGLTFAIEAHRKGHNVRIIERRPDAETFGEMIIITTPALHTPKKWPGFMERARQEAIDPVLNMKKFDGTLIGAFPIGDPKDPSLAIYRSKLHKVLHEYVSELGIPIEFSATASDFFEAGDHAGVIMSDGRKLTADVVVAADGVGTKSWMLVVGSKEPPISSGFILYRVTFPAGPALENPIIAKELGGFKNRGLLHAGPGAHVVSCKSRDEICWMLTRKEDGGDDKEDWANTTSIDKALKAVEGWEPFMTELIKATPNHTVLEWKLLWRNPQRQWVSPGGRIVQIGDAAHPFLPTSASGGTMAMEDAYSLATCLQIGGKDGIPLATKVHNHLRFERVSCAQKMGFKNRELFHNTDWDAVAKNPEVMGKVVGNWLVNHNPEQYAVENYGKCAEHLLNGAPFENTNSVPGYRYKPWTVQELLEASESGKTVQDEGDWS
ncbi:Monooxygenase, FAD-binding [Penicillium griseofulvum]|uniref:Monooxygenase, FAD-binding n=1 Tax=Penicillium patulum TaxID=5078 RepID=A0A135LBS3_PENPA|nr:Monooxygenase, FAD-binding [Penicillium griseofulvum]KXG46427.1 Monooxygenase, FAD-binding [Penicillium griseofulvum]